MANRDADIDLIRALEKVRAEQPPTIHTGAPPGYEVIDDLPAPDDPEHLLRELLTIIWADVDFWTSTIRIEDDFTFWKSTVTMYALRLPFLGAKLWKAFAAAPRNRDELFDVLTKQPWRLESPHLRAMIPSETPFVTVFKHYLRNRALNQASVLRSLLMREDHIRLLSEVAENLADDAQWCLDHPGENPPVSIRKERGRTFTTAAATRRELLCDIIKQHHQASDMEIAKLYAKQHEPEIQAQIEECVRQGQLYTDSLQTLRKEASKARKLAKMRDGVEVAHYVNAEGTRGKRPPRRKQIRGN